MVDDFLEATGAVGQVGEPRYGPCAVVAVGFEDNIEDCTSDRL